jgi:TonB family protein
MRAQGEVIMDSDNLWCDSISLGMWIMFLIIGLTGQLILYHRPAMPPVVIDHPAVEMLDVDLAPVADELVIGDVNSHELDDSLPPPPMAVMEDIPSAPPLTAVADPSTVAFALPVEGPVQVVDVDKAAFSRPSQVAQDYQTDGYSVETLVFGRGDGRQPAPRYPWKAVKRGQEGSVGVVFCVGKNGRVLSAEISRSCPWPLLNESALRTVLHRWKFPAGAIRYYEVLIEFELQK